jgi:hypothetical protein
LIYISHKDKGSFKRDGLQEVIHQDRVDHGGLIHYQEVAVEGLLSILLKASFLNALL